MKPSRRKQRPVTMSEQARRGHPNRELHAIEAQMVAAARAQFDNSRTVDQVRANLTARFTAPLTEDACWVDIDDTVTDAITAASDQVVAA